MKCVSLPPPRYLSHVWRFIWRTSYGVCAICHPCLQTVARVEPAATLYISVSKTSFHGVTPKKLLSTTTNRKLKKAFLKHGNCCSFCQLLDKNFRGISRYVGNFSRYFCNFYLLISRYLAEPTKMFWATVVENTAVILEFSWTWQKRLSLHIKLFTTSHFLCTSRWWISCSVSKPVYLCSQPNVSFQSTHVLV